MIEYLPLVLTGIGIIVSILYYSNVLQNQNKQRKTLHYFEFLQSVSNPEFVETTTKFGSLEINTYEDYQALTQNPENYDLRAYLTWLNGVGKMLEEGLIDKNTLLHFGENIRYMRAWRTIQPYVYMARESNGITWHLAGLESLYNIMSEVWKEQGDPTKLPSNLID